MEGPGREDAEARDAFPSFSGSPPRSTFAPRRIISAEDVWRLLIGPEKAAWPSCVAAPGDNNLLLHRGGGVFTTGGDAVEVVTASVSSKSFPASPNHLPCALTQLQPGMLPCQKPSKASDQRIYLYRSSCQLKQQPLSAEVRKDHHP